MDQPTVDRKSLAATDWQQGSLLPVSANLSPLVWIGDQHQGLAKARKDANNRKRRGQLSAPYAHPWPMGQKHRMALISQDCDVIKAPDDFACVEFALVFETDNANMIATAAGLTSARYFRLGELDGESPCIHSRLLFQGSSRQRNLAPVQS